MFTSQNVSCSFPSILNFNLYVFFPAAPYLYITSTAGEHFCLNSSFHSIDPKFIGLTTTSTQCYYHSSLLASQFTPSSFIWMQLTEMFSGCLYILFRPSFTDLLIIFGPLSKYVIQFLYHQSLKYIVPVLSMSSISAIFLIHAFNFTLAGKTCCIFVEYEHMANFFCNIAKCG